MTQSPISTHVKWTILQYVVEKFRTVLKFNKDIFLTFVLRNHFAITSFKKMSSLKQRDCCVINLMYDSLKNGSILEIPSNIPLSTFFNFLVYNIQNQIAISYVDFANSSLL